MLYFFVSFLLDIFLDYNLEINVNVFEGDMLIRYFNVFFCLYLFYV